MMAGVVSTTWPDIGEKTMRIIVSALIALAVVGGLAGQAGAVDAKTFFEQQDRSRY
jgi:hypothetical protein